MSRLNTGIDNFLPVPELAQTNSGIGLRAPHYAEILEQRPDIGWLEAHSENYFNLGGIPFQQLENCAAHYPISLHGVGLSLGSADGIDPDHLSKLKTVVERINPVLISEHLSWSGNDGRYVPDLLPLPMTQEALEIIAQNIDTVQETLGRQILVENPSGYLAFIEQEMTETEFLKALAKKTGCGLLLDVNNIYVSAHNIGFDAEAYLQDIPPELVGEIHLAGYQINVVDGHEVFIDAHNHPVHQGVWDLYDKALTLLGDIPTLIEWDQDLPPLSELVEQAKIADEYRRKHQDGGSHARTA